MLDHLTHIEQTVGKRDALLDKASPPIYYVDLWWLYWSLRRGDTLLYSEVLAYRELTNEDIGKYEVDVLFMMDDFVNSRLSYHRKDK